MKLRNIIIGASVILAFALGYFTHKHLGEYNSGGSKSSSSAAVTIAVQAQPWEDITIETVEIFVPASGTTPEYTILEKTQYCLSKFPQDSEGWYIIFDGKTFNGWRGYNRCDVPPRWILDPAEGAIKITGSGMGEAQDEDGGDLIFGHKFKDFEFSVDWKVSRASNSGIFYLAREIKGQPIYISAPESQILDNFGNPDGRNPLTASSSLYDMIAANPQNSKPQGEWNNTTIIVHRGNVYHMQNGETVLRYNLWNQRWTEMLQNSKFSQADWPLAFELLNNAGGPTREGYIGLQDHGDDVWFRNMKIKILE